ncbi:MAG: glycosyltransferase family A protein [Caulobacteraceae bacterium]
MQTGTSSSPAQQVPTLSVIVNNYNHERFLPDAIDSVLALDMELAEIVVVDDGSTDGSRDVIARYGDRVKPVLQANTGQLQACLNALAHTTGDYIYFLDADDRVDPAFAHHVPQALAARPAKVQFRLSSLDPDGAPLPSTFPDFPKGYNTARALRDMEVWGLYLSPPTSGNVLRRDVMERVAQTRVEYEKAIDGIALYLAPTMGELVTLDHSLGHYRLHGANIHQQHVLSAPRLRKEVDRTTARWRHFSELTGRPDPFVTSGPPGMVREWLMMIAVAEGRRVRFADGFAFLRQLWASSLRPKAKLLMTAWALALLALPPRMGRTACEWRLSPLNRPKWLNKGITRTGAGAAAST